MSRLPPLDPAVARTRVTVRRALGDAGVEDELVLVALSGGADSLALAAATAFEARSASWRAGAVVIDHGLQEGSDEVARAAARQGSGLGLDPVVVRRVDASGTAGSGPEAAARAARYAAFEAVRLETGASWVLTGHTADDQAEQVLLALARGSGTRSLAGIPPTRDRLLRPFIGLDGAAQHAVGRATTAAACAAQGLSVWHDPHNTDHAYTRVRVRERILPAMERELGPGVKHALVRTAELAREDADALDALALEIVAEAVRRDETGVSVPVEVLAAQPAALRHRIIRHSARTLFAAQLTREHTLQIASLVTHWRGQGPFDVPGATVRRDGDRIVFTPQ